MRSPSCECSQQQSRTCFRLVVVVVIAPSHDCHAPPMHCDLRRFSVYMPQRSGENKRVGKPCKRKRGRCAHAWASSCSVPTSQPVASRRKTRALSGMSSPPRRPSAIRSYPVTQYVFVPSVTLLLGLLLCNKTLCRDQTRRLGHGSWPTFHPSARSVLHAAGLLMSLCYKCQALPIVRV